MQNPDRLLKNVFEQPSKVKIGENAEFIEVNERIEPGFDAVEATQINFQQPAKRIKKQSSSIHSYNQLVIQEA